MGLWKRIRQSFRPFERNRQIDDELAFHLEMRARENEARGMGAAEARRAARLRFGSTARMAEETRERHVLAWVDSLRRDVRFGARGLAKRPLFLLTGLATLALGIGVNVAIFSLLDTMLLKPWPVPEGERLMAIAEQRNGQSTGGSPARLRDYAAGLKSVEAIGGLYSERLQLVSEEPESLSALRVTGDLLGAFGYSVIWGRGFTAEERKGLEPVTLISYELWHSRFAGSPDVTGKAIATRAGSVRIVGVLGPEATKVERYDLWMPMTAAIQDAPRNAGFLMILARVKRGVNPGQANAELQTVLAAMRSANPELDKGLAARMAPLSDLHAGAVETALWLLTASVFTVLLIACANLAGLLLARNAERAREIAIRRAIGAGRWDLVRMFLVEAFCLTVPGGVLGVAAGYWSLALLKRELPQDIPLLPSVGIDWRVLSFALVLTVVCAAAIGLLPAWQASRLKMSRGRLRGGLMVAQVAVSVILLGMTAVFTEGLISAKSRPLGFQEAGVLTIQFEFPWDTDGDKLKRFYRAAEESLQTVVGVRAVGLVDTLPLTGGSQSRSYLRIRGVTLSDAETRQSFGFRAVDPGYFAALRVPLAAGRLMADRVRDEVVVNETFARKYFAGRDPLGSFVSVADPGQAPKWMEIVGVTADVAVSGMDRRPKAEVFVHYEQTYWPEASLVAYMEGDPRGAIRAARAAIDRVDPHAPIRYAGPLDARLDDTWWEPTLIARLIGGVSVAAVALVLVGIYGMLAGFVRARTKEFGVRMALGATPGSLVRLSLRYGLRLAVTGLVLGLLGTVPAVQAIASLIPGGNVAPPLAYGATVGIMLGAALLASFGPARRASKLDPSLALRHD